MSLKTNYPLSLILHNVRSAENVGSILRTTDAVGLPDEALAKAGVDRVYLCGITPAPVDRFGRPNSKVLKASLGAEKSVAWEERDDVYELVHELKKEGREILALEQAPQSINYTEIKVQKNSVLIVGNEVEGIEEALLALCDTVLEIPMRGTKESLNVAVATGIALYSLLYSLPTTH